METVREVCKFIGGLVGPDPLCIETGCVYTCAPGNEIHTTSNNIIEYICAPNKGQLISIDIDWDHINFAHAFVREQNVPLGWVAWVQGDSVAELKRLAKKWRPPNERHVDVLCLDSKEFDEDHMVNEFMAIKDFLRPNKHFVLVDDIHNKNSVKYKKMVPLLKELGYVWLEVPTPTGLFFAAKGYPVE